MGHARDKIELIVMGGTFLSYPPDYQYQFVKDCYDALNGVCSTSLEEAKKMNEDAEHRCVGLCIETRPDFCGEEETTRMLDFGATRVELGVQTLDDEIHSLTKRGHGVAEIMSATRLLRDHGFKVYYHWMPGLPGATPEHDLELSKQLFEDAYFRPDGLKLYPTLVVRGSELENWYRDNRYRPYHDEVMIDLLVAIKTSDLQVDARHAGQIHRSWGPGLGVERNCSEEDGGDRRSLQLHSLPRVWASPKGWLVSRRASSDQVGLRSRGR
jgi:elongator complex protein 3